MVKIEILGAGCPKCKKLAENAEIDGKIKKKKVMSIKKKKMELRPIGIIHSPFKQACGTPTQPTYADGAGGCSPRVLNKT